MGREWPRQGKGSPGPGCWSGFLHFLDFHQLLFTPTTTRPAPAAHCGPSSPGEKLKGVEAPRNSLEVEGPGTTQTICTHSGEYYHDDDDDIPVGIQITVPADFLATKKNSFLEEERKSTSSLPTKPKGFYLERERRSTSAVINEKRKETFFMEEERRSTSAILTVKKPFLSQEEERRCTESPRTPGLVARLMGLDMLPDGALPVPVAVATTSSTSASSLLYNHQFQPPKKTSKVSDENKRKSPYQSRRPLQDLNCNFPATPWEKDTKFRFISNKENYTHGTPTREFVEIPRKRDGSGGHLLEEKMSNRINHHSKKIVDPALVSVPCNKKRKPPAASRSPPNPQFSKPQTKQKLPGDDERTPLRSIRSRRTKPAPSSSPSKKPVYDRYTERIQNSVGRHPSPPTRNISCKSPKARQYMPSLHSTPENAHCCHHLQTLSSSQASERSSEFQYVRSILVHSGILARSFASYSTARPIIDPIIFHKLELQFPATAAASQLGSLRHRCNRKLLFNLVQEAASQIPAGHRRSVTGDALLSLLRAQILGSPSADVDQLVGINVRESSTRRTMFQHTVAEEAEEIVDEIAGSLIDSLIGEAAASLMSKRYGRWR